MNNKLIIIFQMLMIFLSLIYSQNVELDYELWQRAQMLESQNDTDKALELYLKIFEENCDFNQLSFF